MRNKRLYLTMLVALLVALLACAPKVAPTPAPPAAPVQASPAIPAPLAPAVAPEDTAWAKVVAAARKEGKFTMYSFYMVGDTGIKMKRAFKERTGLDVEFITGTGAPLIERIKAERRGGFQVASVMDTAVILSTQAKMEGLTEAAGPLPELQNRELWKKSPIVDKEGHIQVSSISLRSSWVNTRLVKPGEEPKSYRDLLQPRWKGKIGMGDPDTSPPSISAYYQLVKKHGILDDAYFRELGKSVKLYPNIRMDAEAVAKGDVDISFANAATAMSPFLQAGAPIKTIDMEEGGSRQPWSGNCPFVAGPPHQCRPGVYQLVALPGGAAYLQ